MKKSNLLLSMLSLALLTGCSDTTNLSVTKESSSNEQTTSQNVSSAKESSIDNGGTNSETSINDASTNGVTSNTDGKIEYVFEAEYSPDIEDLKVPDFSGTRLGTEAIGCETPEKEFNCSNGYFVYPLAKPQAYLSFKINSDREVKNATFVWRITGYCFDITLNPGFYDIYVNSESIDYNTINITGVPGYTRGFKAFEDYTLTKRLHLKKGENTFYFYTNNNVNPGGQSSTYQATAPAFDCFKITTDAVLTWEPCVSNLD